MSGSPHRRQENPGPPSGRMAGLPQPPPRQSKLAIHDRRRPRQAEKTIPSVRMTRATSTAQGLRLSKEGSVLIWAIDIIALIWTLLKGGSAPGLTGGSSNHVTSTGA